jgi:tetratricopeptide (TPR) repeat protein
MPWYWRSHALYRRCGVRSERLRSLLGASACLRILNRFPQARKMWRDVRRSAWAAPLLSRSPGERGDSLFAEVLLEQALVERGLGHHAAAGRTLHRCIAAFARTRDAEALRHAWWALAGVERFSGRFRPALRAFRKAESLARRTGDASAEAYALCGQAACHRLLGGRRPAFSKYKAAHRIFVRTKDRFGQAYGLCGMGNALRVYGDARRARLPYEAALARFEAAKRAVPNKSAYGLLARFGISAETAASWKDVP